MKIKKEAIIGLGILATVGMSAIGASKVSANINKKVNFVSLVTAEKAKAIMLEKVPGGTILELSYDGEGANPKYDGKLIAGEYEYEVDVDAKTGKVVTFEKTKVSIANNTTQKTNENKEQEKNEVATTDEPVVNTQQEPEVENPVVNTPQESVVNQQVPSYTPPVSTPQVNQNAGGSTLGIISEAQAKSIMQGMVPSGATLIKFKLDYDDGRPEYEAEFISGTIEYDITIDARTGTVLEFDQESIYD